MADIGPTADAQHPCPVFWHDAMFTSRTQQSLTKAACPAGCNDYHEPFPTLGATGYDSCLSSTEPPIAGKQFSCDTNTATLASCGADCARKVNLIFPTAASCAKFHIPETRETKAGGEERTYDFKALVIGNQTFRLNAEPVLTVQDTLSESQDMSDDAIIVVAVLALPIVACAVLALVLCRNRCGDDRQRSQYSKLDMF